jgi:hypothetical protein
MILRTSLRKEVQEHLVIWVGLDLTILLLLPVSCDAVSRPPLYYVLPRFINLFIPKKDLVAKLVALRASCCAPCDCLGLPLRPLA